MNLSIGPPKLKLTGDEYAADPLERRFKAAAIAVAIIALVILAVNISLIGGDEFVIAFNSLLNPPLAIIITVLAAIIWRQMSAEKHSRCYGQECLSVGFVDPGRDSMGDLHHLGPGAAIPFYG